MLRPPVASQGNAEVAKRRASAQRVQALARQDERLIKVVFSFAGVKGGSDDSAQSLDLYYKDGAARTKMGSVTHGKQIAFDSYDGHEWEVQHQGRAIQTVLLDMADGAAQTVKLRVGGKRDEL